MGFAGLKRVCELETFAIFFGYCGKFVKRV